MRPLATALVVPVLLLMSACAHAQSAPARAAHAGEPAVVGVSTPPSASPTLAEPVAPQLHEPLLLQLPATELQPETATTLRLEVPEHAAATPMLFAQPTSNFLADELYRVRPVNGWTWVSLGLGTASLGVAAAFFRAAGLGTTPFLPAASSATPIAVADAPSRDPLSIIGSYTLRYDNLGTLSLQAGLGAVSSTLFRLIYAPRDPRAMRYMRTFVTELQGGWLFGFQGSL